MKNNEVSKIKLPAIFTDNMVLQRRAHVCVWGEAQDTKYIEVSIAGQTRKTEVVDGRFELKLNPMEAGGPYELCVKALQTDKQDIIKDEACTIVFKNVLVGEVWLAGGQSNMELELQNSDNGKEVVAHTKDELLRFYYTPKVSYICDELFKAEQESCWMKCEPGTTATWSAVAYYWAVRMRKELNVPVGIVGCNWGGTYAHNWVSRESLLSHDKTAHFVTEYEDMVAHQDFDEYLKELEDYREYYKEWVKRVDACYAKNPEIEWSKVLELCGENRWPGPSGPRFEYRPYGLYESMLIRVAPYTIKGALYYQGENDENNNEIYDILLENLITEWRRLWHDDELAFSIVQLPVHDPDTEKTGRGWGGIRRAQDKICRTIKNTSLTVITDCGNKKNIHPTDKKTVGERLAANTLKDIYGLGGYNGNGPRLSGYEFTCRDGHEGILLHFSGVDDGFYRKKADCEGAASPEELVRIDNQGEKTVFGAGDSKNLASGFEICCRNVAADSAKNSPANTATDDVENGSASSDNDKNEKVTYYRAIAEIAGSDIFIYNENVSEPVSARYGNDNYFRPIFLDKCGRPIVPFWI